MAVADYATGSGSVGATTGEAGKAGYVPTSFAVRRSWVGRWIGWEARARGVAEWDVVSYSAVPGFVCGSGFDG